MKGVRWNGSNQAEIAEFLNGTGFVPHFVGQMNAVRLHLNEWYVPIYGWVCHNYQGLDDVPWDIEILPDGAK